jgi:hypothetical protein
MGIKYNGTLWGWGFNGGGQLGLGNTTEYSSPKQVGALTDWLQVSASRYGSAAIKTNGTLWSWGPNNLGQLGLGNTTNRSSPVQVGAETTWSKLPPEQGARHSFAIKTDGTLWAWGSNNLGQLGLNDTINRFDPAQVGTLTTWYEIHRLEDAGFCALKT